MSDAAEELEDETLDLMAENARALILTYRRVTEAARHDRLIVMRNSGSLVIARPHKPEERGLPLPPWDYRDSLRRLIETLPDMWGEITLGELLVWACKAARCVDPQPIGGNIFDRGLVRDAVQAFVLWGMRADETIEVALCKHDTAKAPDGVLVRFSVPSGPQAWVMMIDPTAKAPDGEEPGSDCPPVMWKGPA